MYEMKKNKEAFTMVEGPFKGRTFAPGKSYDEVPSNMIGSFVKAGEPVRPEPVEGSEPADAKKGRK